MKHTKPFEDMQYFPMAEKLVNILQDKTQNKNPLFFRVITAFYLTNLASQMRVMVKGYMNDLIPVNMYAIALSPSGTGKGLSTGLIENRIMSGYKEVFLEHTLPISAEKTAEQIAIKRASRNGTDVQEEIVKLAKDYKSLGAYLPSFDSATTPAIKQMRQKLLMAGAGSLNLIIDEFGANLQSSIEPLHTYLEIYDRGYLKERLIKSSNENLRFERIEGHTPANLLAFGTPTKLLDAAMNERTLFELLDMGYARRCYFGYAEKPDRNVLPSIEDAIAMMNSNNSDQYLDDLNDELSLLADLSNLNKHVTLTPDALRTIVGYKLDCEHASMSISELETIKKAELEHRHFKSLKLAGAYAFVAGSDTVEVEHVEAAIKLAEDSGEAFNRLMTPQRPYEKLARYLAEYKREVTLADLDEDLPSFKGTKAERDNQIMMATAWGYSNNIIIKKSFTNTIMFLSAETIQETNLDKMIISYTNNPDMTKDYRNETVPFDKLPVLFGANGYHWLNHHVEHQYRKEENAIKGFNLLVLDVDGTCSLSTAKLLLKDYKAIYYTTKSHTPQNNRFRIILPTNYVLKMDSKEFKEFYQNVVKDLPFEVDEQCGHRSKKWLSNGELDDDGKVVNIEFNDGELFNVLPYIPKTSQNEERLAKLDTQEDMDNLERWVMNNTGDGNRNNMLLRFAMILVDAGFGFEAIKEKVISLNQKLDESLTEMELASTILHTVANKLVSIGKSVS